MGNKTDVVLKLETMQKRPALISRLINSILYFIELVFILSEKEGYRLIAIHQNKVLTDQTYKTAKGAKIAFLKFWSYRACQEGVKPMWSHFYPLDEKWLKKKMEILIEKKHNR